MGFFKSLAYIAGGAALAPFTGGASLAAGIAITVAAKKTKAYASQKLDERDSRIRSEAMKAGEAIANRKYEKKIEALVGRLQGYHDADEKLVGMYAVGLAIANADGDICMEEREELDAFVIGCMSGHLPAHIKETITSLSANPPSIERAIEFAQNARLPKQDIDDIIELISLADERIADGEKAFINRWQEIARSYELA